MITIGIKVKKIIGLLTKSKLTKICHLHLFNFTNIELLSKKNVDLEQPLMLRYKSALFQHLSNIKKILTWNRNLFLLTLYIKFNQHTYYSRSYIYKIQTLYLVAKSMPEFSLSLSRYSYSVSQPRDKYVVTVSEIR